MGVVEDLTAEHVFGRRAAATDRLVVAWLLRAYYTGGSGRNRGVSAISSVTPIKVAGARGDVLVANSC